MQKTSLQVMKMCLTKCNNNSRVMVFIDLRNILRGAKMSIPHHFRVDLEEMVNQMVHGRNLMGAYIFDGEPAGENKESCEKFHRCLQHLGFRLNVRGSYDPESDAQKEVDVAMATEMVFHAMSDHFDVAIVATGDRDFLPAVEMVQRCGKIVEVASFRANSSNTLARGCDFLHKLDRMSIIEACDPEVIAEDEATVVSEDAAEELPVIEPVAVAEAN